MDMRTTQVCYSTPAAVLTDVALHELFRVKYGLVHNVEPAYVEAKVPGHPSDDDEALPADGLRQHGESAVGHRRVG